MATGSAIAELPYLDVDRDDYDSDPWAVVSPVRELSRVARSRRGLEVLAHDSILEILRDKNRLTPPLAVEFGEKGASPKIVQFIADGVKAFMEPETHKRARRIFGEPFRLSKIDAMRPRMRELSNELIDGFIEKGQSDLVADFSDHLSIGVLCEMIGLPVEDMPEISHYNQEVVLLNADPIEPVVPRVEAAIDALTAYVEALVAKRRAEPRDDVIGALIEAEATEGKLSAGELTAGIVDLMFAGQDTTRLQIPSITRALIEEDDWADLTERPEIIPAAIEEGMRWYPSVHHFKRIVREPGVEIDGIPMQVGDQVMLNVLAASRDPDRFELPNTFIVDRQPPLFEVGFGFGLHHCLGHAFARATMQEGFTALSSRLGGLEFAGPHEIGPGHGATVNGVERLPITFDRI